MSDIETNHSAAATPLRKPRRSLNGIRAGGRTPSEPLSAHHPEADKPTSAEAFYFQKQIQARTQMVAVLDDGEEVRGCLEWYDRDCLKFRRNNGTRVLIYKTSIRFLHKASENSNQE